MAHALFPHRTETARSAGHLSGRWVAALALAAAFVVLLLDALVNPVAVFDVWLIKLIQRPDDPAIWPVFDAVKALTGSEGAVLAWIVVGLVFLVRRWWAAAVALGLIPIGGVINEGVSLFLVERSRPHLDGLYRTSLNYEEHSFPSGHVTGAVLLYGLIFVVARRIEHVVLRLAVQSFSVAIVAVTGFQRVWGGAHWPSDVLAAYALGGMLLIGLVAVWKALEPELAGLSLPAAAGHTLALSVMVAGRTGRMVSRRLTMPHGRGVAGLAPAAGRSVPVDPSATDGSLEVSGMETDTTVEDGAGLPSSKSTTS